MPSAPHVAPTIRVFIAGGSYAGMSAALNLLDLGAGKDPRMAYDGYPHVPQLPEVDFQITMVDERDGYYHVIGSPLALADAKYSEKAWVQYKDIPALQHPSITIIQGSVTNVDCASKTAEVRTHNTTDSNTTHHYDYFVAASGLRRPWPVVPQSLTRKQYLVEAGAHIRRAVASTEGVVVVGGGAVGIEMAAELKMTHPHVRVTLAHSRDKLLSSEGLAEECKDKALELLREGGVEVLMNHRLAKSTRVADSAEGESGVVLYELEFTNGHTMKANDVVMAVSHPVPATDYLPASTLDEHGYIKILPNLSFLPSPTTPNAPSHFCAGDASSWSGIKRCGAAMHGGHFAARNIHQSVARDVLGSEAYEPAWSEFDHVPPMIGLAVGKKAVASGPDGTTSGEDVAKLYFGDDLGWTVCWNYMKLGEAAIKV